MLPEQCGSGSQFLKLSQEIARFHLGVGAPFGLVFKGHQAETTFALGGDLVKTDTHAISQIIS